MLWSGSNPFERSLLAWNQCYIKIPNIAALISQETILFTRKRLDIKHHCAASISYFLGNFDGLLEDSFVHHLLHMSVVVALPFWWNNCWGVSLHSHKTATLTSYVKEGFIRWAVKQSTFTLDCYTVDYENSILFYIKGRNAVYIFTPRMVSFRWLKGTSRRHSLSIMLLRVN